MDLMPVLLLLVLGLPVAGGAAMLLFVMMQVRRECRTLATLGNVPSAELPQWLESPRPLRWLAVRGSNLAEVQDAFGMKNPEPCSLHDGLTCDKNLFVAPMSHGWMLVTGARLPDPEDDVDACFRFVVGASRKLGHVQYFCADPFQHHHAWVKAEHGAVLRAYAWAGTTLWNQGRLTEVESDLGLNCFDYDYPSDERSREHREEAVANTEKVAALAGRWSFDPGDALMRRQAEILGVAGETSFRGT